MLSERAFSRASDSIPIRPPRLPQTRAASFKWLYRKRPACAVRPSPAVKRRAASDTALTPNVQKAAIDALLEPVQVRHTEAPSVAAKVFLNSAGGRYCLPAWLPRRSVLQLG